jgi:mono/diheme cytochrome c family protein
MAQKPSADQLAKGKKYYEQAGGCFACHQLDGQGMPGSIPPLAKSSWVLDKDPGRMISLVLKGLAGPIMVDNVKYNSMMPPQLLYQDAELADLLTYVRNAWGNKGDVITVAQIKATRAKLPKDPAMLTPEQLLKQYPKFSESDKRKKNGTFTITYEDTVGNPTEPVVWRTFMPGASPAAFAIALPGPQYVCWDAGECRLRYVWTKGGFIQNNRRHWESNGKPVADFYGQPYYTAHTEQLKPEDAETLKRTNLGTPLYDTSQLKDFPVIVGAGTDELPQFRGMKLVKGYPEFLYSIGDTQISERYSISADKLGIVRHFRIDSGGKPVTVKLTPSKDAKLSASAGELNAATGELKLSASDAKAFSVTITETNPAALLPAPGGK